MVKKLFSDSELTRIEEAVATAEKKTSGEIVVLVVPRSDFYAWVHWAWGFLGYLVVSLGLFIENWVSPFSIPLFWILSAQLAGFALCAALPFIPAIKRFSLLKDVVALRVHQHSLAQFTMHGLAGTRRRTGILVMLSLLERRVEILADSGIHKKTGEGYWTEQVSHIVEGIHQGKATDAVCKAIEDMGKKLAENFPPEPDDTDELSNRIRQH